MVGVGVEEAEPAEAVDAGERVEEGGEAVLEAEVFAVAGGVLADEGDLADAAGDELLGFGDDGLEAAGAELAAQVGDDAEAAGVVAAFGDLDVGRGARGGEDSAGWFVVEIGGQRVRRRRAQASRGKRPCCSRRSPSGRTPRAEARLACFVSCCLCLRERWASVCGWSRTFGVRRR